MDDWLDGALASLRWAQGTLFGQRLGLNGPDLLKYRETAEGPVGMIFDVITIFPGFFESFLIHGLFKRAIEKGIVTVNVIDLRDFTDDRHRTVDDRPFGGGPGMVLKPEPLFRAVESLRDAAQRPDFPVVLLSPQGRLLQQPVVAALAGREHVILICGRYEGVDERVVTGLATDEISIGDYILSGGELAAAVVMEAVTRMLPGALGNEESPQQDSFSGLAAGVGPGANGATAGMLDCPHFTRPAEFRGMRVPEVLLSGNHQEIAEWRRRQALAKTRARRPDLIRAGSLSETDLTVPGGRLIRQED